MTSNEVYRYTETPANTGIPPLREGRDLARMGSAIDGGPAAVNGPSLLDRHLNWDSRRYEP